MAFKRSIELRKKWEAHPKNTKDKEQIETKRETIKNKESKKPPKSLVPPP